MPSRKTNRREFLKCSALIGAAALASETLLRAQETPDAAVKVDTTVVNMAIPSRPKPARQITIPDVGEFKVLKGDFHMHTLFSDGRVMPADRVSEAVENGLDVISITDHIEVRPFIGGKGRWKLQDGNDNHNASYEIAKPEADKRKLLLIRGTEITKSKMPPGHFNALFVQDVNPIAAAVDDWQKMLQISADQGAFLLWNHPGWVAPKWGGIEAGAPMRFTPEHEEVYKKGLMHGIEVFNGGEYYPIVSDWCNQRDLAVIADSDNHASEWDRYGLHSELRPITLVLAKEKTIDSVREAFFAKRTIGWAGGMVWGRDPWLPQLFKASVEIKTVTPGTLELTNRSSLPCTVKAGGVMFDLPKDVSRQVYRAQDAKNLLVTNWMVGTNKPLEIPIS